METAHVQNGLDRIDAHASLFAGKRIGLVTGPTGLDRNLVSGIDLFRERFNLVALYSPEHGLYGEAQAGDSVSSTTDSHTGLPVWSLYGKTKDPEPAMVEGVDLLVFDMQDIGVRYYTYLYTLSHLMAGCARLGVPLAVLDRVNPLGGMEVAGNILDKRFSSFVGEHALPVVHSLTVGEFAQWVNREESYGCDLTVVPCAGWLRTAAFPETGLPWVMPSPNMPSVETVRCYAGTCLFEGTNLSEGRGTTKPFEIVGAPFVDGRRLADEMNAMGLPGVRFRAVFFRPTFSKHAGEACQGVQLHLTDVNTFDAFRTGLWLLTFLRRQYREFAFLENPAGTWFMDHLAGTDALRAGDFSPDDFLAAGKRGVEAYANARESILLYP